MQFVLRQKIGTQWVLVHTRNVRDGLAFRLPRVRPEREWSFDVTGAEGYAIEEVGLSMSMSRLQDA